LVAAKEAACCSFLRLEVGAEDGLIRLDITSVHPEAAPVIELLAQQAAA
jgi:transcriptional accessory protein Tex/SPT6